MRLFRAAVGLIERQDAKEFRQKNHIRGAALVGGDRLGAGLRAEQCGAKGQCGYCQMFHRVTSSRGVFRTGQAPPLRLRKYWPDHFCVCNGFLRDFPPRCGSAGAETGKTACFMGCL